MRAARQDSPLRRLLVAAAAKGQHECAAVRLRRRERAAASKASRSACVWSNLALQWLNDLPRAFAEFRRTLKVGGLVDVHDARSRHAEGAAQRVCRAPTATRTSTGSSTCTTWATCSCSPGFADPVMEMEQMTLTYADPRALLAELKALGATNATRGPSARPRWAGAVAADARRARKMQRDDRIPATFEVVYGHAWKGGPKRTAEGHPIVTLQRKPPQ